MEFELGQTYAGYKFLDVAKRTRNGVEYRVENTLAQRMEMLKVLPPGVPDDREETERFMREMPVRASLVHPNIVTFFTAMPLEDSLVLTTELVEGLPLSERLLLGPIPWREAADFARQLLAAVDCAHQHQIVHRDISPDNIIALPGGVLKLTNFRLAKSIAGSLKYISPEQVKNAEARDHRSDLYSIGIVLYEMLAGRTPFNSPSPFELMLAHVNQQPEPPGKFNSTVPSKLDGVVLKALAKFPSDRYQSAGEFDEALARVVAEIAPEEIVIAPEAVEGTAQELPSPVEAKPEPEPLLAPAIAEVAPELAEAAAELSQAIEAVPVAEPVIAEAAPDAVVAAVELFPAIQAQPVAEPVIAEAAPEPVVAAAEFSQAIEAEPVAEPVIAEAAPEPVAAPAELSQAIEAEPVAEPVIAEAAPEPVVAAAELSQTIEAEPVAEPVIAEAAPEPVVAAAEFSQAIEADPVAEPVIAEAAPEPVVAAAELSQAIEAEPVAEPVIAEAAPEPVVAAAELSQAIEAEPVAEPVTAEAAPEPVVAAAEPGPDLSQIQPEPKSLPEPQSAAAPEAPPVPVLLPETAVHASLWTAAEAVSLAAQEPSAPSLDAASSVLAESRSVPGETAPTPEQPAAAGDAALPATAEPNPAPVSQPVPAASAPNLSPPGIPGLLVAAKVTSESIQWAVFGGTAAFLGVIWTAIWLITGK